MALLTLLLISGSARAGAADDDLGDWIGPRTLRCPEGWAMASGPPAKELFDPYTQYSGLALWCERYDRLGRPSREGAYRDFHPGGQERTFARFRNDRLEGPLLMLHANGRPWVHTFYRDGKLHGPYVVFTPTGAPWIEAHYEKGKAVGRHVVYHPTGGMASLTFYRGGREEGLSRAWYPNGQMSQEIEVEDGLFSGRYTRWYENGQFESRGQYARCPAGSTSPTCEHLGVARHGRWRTWHRNGSQASQGEFQYGERVGEWLYWTPTGEPSNTDVTQKREDGSETPPPASRGTAIVPLPAPSAGGTGHGFRRYAPE